MQEDDIQTFPMVDVPDDQLDEEGKKEKRKQKLLKSNYDARMRMKAEKKAEKARVAEEKRKDEESRAADPEAWAARLREDHAVSRGAGESTRTTCSLMRMIGIPGHDHSDEGA